MFFNLEVTLTPPSIHSALTHPSLPGSSSSSGSCGPPCSTVTLPPSLTCTQDWEDQASRHLELGREWGVHASPMRCSRNRAKTGEKANGLREEPERTMRWRRHRASLLPTWKAQNPEERRKQAPSPRKQQRCPFPNHHHQGSLGPLGTLPDGHIWALASEEAKDVCFCVSHIHLHTFYIFICKGLNKLFSAFFKLKCYSCSR